MARVLKAKYYAREDWFLSATVRPNASFVWRSILASQELLKGRIRRRIGNGMTSTIWNSLWLPHPSDPWIATTMPPEAASMPVASLINAATETWDMERVVQLLNARDQILISKLVISIDCPDGWFWNDDVRGIYPVRSAYRALTGESVVVHTPSGFSCWARLWGLSLPPKLKVFC